MWKSWMGAALALAMSLPVAATGGRVHDAELRSKVLADNLVGVDPLRRIKVYLPPGYERSSARYPVVYYIHSTMWSPRQVFEESRLGEFVDRAIGSGRLGEVIVVAGDFTTPSGFNFFGNDRVAGRWIDHIVDELVPFVDASFRTRAAAASRAITGDFFGGFAALKVPMLRPGVFGALYALHPVGTGTGLQPGMWRPDWKVVHAARNWEDLRRDTYAPVFVAMAQAYLPNASRPPFFCDFMVEPANGGLEPRTSNIITMYSRFLLDSLLIEHGPALKQMRGVKIDWGRYDPTLGHVYAAQAFTRKLEEYGIPHFAEEYSGNEWNRLFVPHGRVEADLLPFFAEFLEGAAPTRAVVRAGGAR
jgi:enterochelin esterase-like enzyme